MKNSIVLKALYTSAHLVIPCVLNILAPPQHTAHGRDHRMRISLAQMGRRNTPHCYWEEPPTPCPSHPHPSPAPQIKLPHQLDSTHWCRGRGCCFSLPFHGLTSFSGVLTMANVDPFSLQKFMLLFQDNSDLDKKKHLPWWKSHPLGQTTEIQEKRGWD